VDECKPLANGDIVVNKRAETALNNDKNLSGRA
jgi:hypothetical protein